MMKMSNSLRLRACISPLSWRHLARAVGALVVAVMPALCEAGAGDLDPTFGDGGLVTHDVLEANSSANGMGGQSRRQVSADNAVGRSVSSPQGLAVAAAVSVPAGASQWDTELVAASGDVGFNTSLAFDPADGHPSIAYSDFTNDRTKFDHYNVSQALSPGWTGGIVDSQNNVGFHAAIAFDPGDGNPSVAYSDHTAGRTKFAHWNGISWGIADVGSGAGWLTLVYRGSGDPTIAYLDNFGGNINYAYLDGSTWTVDQVNDRAVDADVSLAYDSAGDPAISFMRRARGQQRDLKLARLVGSSWQTEVVEAGVGAKYNSLAFDSSGNAAIAYSHDADDDNKLDTLKYAEWNGSAWEIEVVQTGTKGFGVFADLAFDAAGSPAIVHRAAGEVFFVLRNGSSWDVETVYSGLASGCTLKFDSTGTAYVGFGRTVGLDGEVHVSKRLGVGSYDDELVDFGPFVGFKFSVGIGPGDKPAIVYYDYDADDLYYAEKSAPCSTDADCDDGNLCTTDVCNAGSCENTSLDCDDGNACTIDSCDPSTGQCKYPPTPVDCDDGDPCSDDTCDPMAGCSNTFPACGLLDGCCGPDCDSGNDPDCCAGPGDPCANNADCCSNKCKGKPRNKTCN